MTKLYHSSPYDMTHIEPRPVAPLGNVVFAQADEVLAHAYALKSPAMFLAGNPCDWRYAVIDASRYPDWRNLLHRRDNTSGGFIYEVDPATFMVKTTQFGNEIVSKTSPTILSRRFVTPEDAMQKGVQLFIVTSPDYSGTQDGWEKGHLEAINFLLDGYRTGGISCLNEQTGLNHHLPPYLREGLAAKPRTALRPER